MIQKTSSISHLASKHCLPKDFTILLFKLLQNRQIDRSVVISSAFHYSIDLFTDGHTGKGLSRDMCVHGWTYRLMSITGYVCSRMDVQVKVYHGICVLMYGRTG